MKDLKSFKNTSKESENIVDKYKDLSEEELLDLLIKQVKTAKENGELDSEQTKNFVRLISPKLTDEQRQKLETVMKIADIS